MRISDWSSDVCSSYLLCGGNQANSVRVSGAGQQKRPLAAAQILSASDLESRCFGELTNQHMLRVPDFKDREAPRSQYSRQIRDNAAIIVETVGAREQRARGLGTGDIGHEVFVIRVIGRIAENERK